MGRVKQRYNRRAAEKRFEHVYQPVAGDRCIYCGMPNDGKLDHQPPVYILHRFADGGLVTKKAIRERFGECRLVPCCTICNMGLGAFHGRDDNERRREIANWFLVDERYPEDALVVEVGRQLIESRLDGSRGTEVYDFPGVGRVIYIHALFGFMEGEFNAPDEFPDWLRVTQSELAEWLRAEPKRKSKYFLDMAKLVSYDLLPHARDDPRGQLKTLHA
ncbi:hypothetical protein [Arvimicrobium flavum]|uniref:hypothetical protein n=1 Tax=Arvimicrobium flavum TaxID=3393320 RepID=UPI00237A569B|nr:hypothetical protein [Mesorhizobium shangrilense]